ncbi:CBS domain-containing protein CBSX2, chloroplastic-like [Curcuma longa]|uniref:CBS domain-containing protein CBSX2, chloroplastic-like n=1 Tax=Curcuma longa TaxID=136217 RepID=UPI003D9F3848
MLSMELVLARSPPTLGVNASPSLLPLHSRRSAPFLAPRRQRLFVLRPPVPASPPTALAHNGTVTSQDNGVYTVGHFMTKKEDLHVVKPSTSIDEALELLVENRVTGFPVIDDDWNLVGVVSDYDLLALDSFQVLLIIFHCQN